MTPKLLTAEDVAKLRMKFECADYVLARNKFLKTYGQDMLDTLEAALKVVAAAKVVRYWEVAFEQKIPDGEVKFLIDQKDGLKLLEALAPFTPDGTKEGK